MRIVIDILVGLTVLWAATFGIENGIADLKNELASRLSKQPSLVKLTTQLTGDDKWWE